MAREETLREELREEVLEWIQSRREEEIRKDVRDFLQRQIQLYMQKKGIKDTEEKFLEKLRQDKELQKGFLEFVQASAKAAYGKGAKKLVNDQMGEIGQKTKKNTGSEETLQKAEEDINALKTRVKEHPKARKQLEIAEKEIEALLKVGARNADFSFIALIIMAAQAVAAIMKQVQAGMRTGYAVFLNGYGGYRVWRATRIANRYIEENNLKLTEEQREAIEKRLERMLYEDEVIDESRIKEIINEGVKKNRETQEQPVEGKAQVQVGEGEQKSIQAEVKEVNVDGVSLRAYVNKNAVSSVRKGVPSIPLKPGAPKPY